MNLFSQRLGLSFTVLFLTATFCYAQKPRRQKAAMTQVEVADVGFKCSDKKRSKEPYFETVLAVGDITRRASKLPRPKLNSKARAAGISGEVSVEVIVVGQSGKIVWARVKSGHPLLREAVKDVVCQARFSPSIIEGKIIGVRGTLTYKFPDRRKRVTPNNSFNRSAN